MRELLTVSKADIFPQECIFRNCGFGDILISEASLSQFIISIEVACGDDYGDFVFDFGIFVFEEEFAYELNCGQPQNTRHYQRNYIFHISILLRAICNLNIIYNLHQEQRFFK